MPRTLLLEYLKFVKLAKSEYDALPESNMIKIAFVIYTHELFCKFIKARLEQTTIGKKLVNQLNKQHENAKILAVVMLSDSVVMLSDLKNNSDDNSIFYLAFQKQRNNAAHSRMGDVEAVTKETCKKIIKLFKDCDHVLPREKQNPSAPDIP